MICKEIFFSTALVSSFYASTEVTSNNEEQFAQTSTSIKMKHTYKSPVENQKRMKGLKGKFLINLIFLIVMFIISIFTLLFS